MRHRVSAGPPRGSERRIAPQDPSGRARAAHGSHRDLGQLPDDGVDSGDLVGGPLGSGPAAALHKVVKLRQFLSAPELICMTVGTLERPIEQL